MVLFKRILEVGCFFVLIEICIWYIWPLHNLGLRKVFEAGMVLAIIASCYLHRDTLWSMGLRSPITVIAMACLALLSLYGGHHVYDALWPIVFIFLIWAIKPNAGISWAGTRIITLVAMLNLLLLAWVGHRYGTPSFNMASFGHQTYDYLPWALVQQAIACSFFTNRLYASFGKGWEWATSMTSGALFAVAHIPNPVLFLVTFVNGVLGARIFITYRNIYVLAAAHAVLATAIKIFLPWDWHRGLSIGVGFFK